MFLCFPNTERVRDGPPRGGEPQEGVPRRTSIGGRDGEDGVILHVGRRQEVGVFRSKPEETAVPSCSWRGREESESEREAFRTCTGIKKRRGTGPENKNMFPAAISFVVSIRGIFMVLPPCLRHPCSLSCSTSRPSHPNINIVLTEGGVLAAGSPPQPPILELRVCQGPNRRRSEERCLLRRGCRRRTHPRVRQWFVLEFVGGCASYLPRIDVILQFSRLTYFQTCPLPSG